MKRRTFNKIAGLGAVGLGMTGPSCTPSQPATHILSLSFDDGFKKSFYTIADIYEKHGLSACFNVIASGHLDDFEAVDPYILPEILGDFNDWNALLKRGHEVMPHSWKHANLGKMPLEEAQGLIEKCLAFFEKHLDGYDGTKAVFNFPFNSSTKALNDWTATKVRAIRTGGGDALNPIPNVDSKILYCASKGPENIDNWVEEKVESFLKEKGGWLILNTHGLDGEGWGPMSAARLDEMLERWVKVSGLEILPVGMALEKYG
ncbi:MAG: polysaccharide deacetylase family protein [Cyclobacteriaceae bacterium]|nr:polysaccharide deacetylase family protein [Cyclobacteriaceae bacterium]